MLQPGTTLDHDKYRIEAVIGRGGFGHVYRARERLTGETVAIKELVPSFVDDQQMVQRFIQEARLTLRLSYRHIVRTYGVFQDRGTYYLAMEYVPGGSLADRLKHGALPIEEAVRIASELCEALEEAHQQAVVHCDIKPANVLFDDQGRVHLTDFGIAHVSAELMSRKFFTTTGTALGTVRYMSPEQLAGVRDDPRIDIYALGALLYEMLAGRPYLDFETDGTPRAQGRNIAKIEKESPGPLRAVNPAVPDWLAQVVRRALQKAPGDRFATVGQLQDALQGGSETPSVPPSPPAPPRRRWATQAVDWLRSLPVAAAPLGGLAAVALLSCSAMGVWYTIRPAPSPQVTPTVTLTPTNSATPPTPVLAAPSPTSPPPDRPTHTPPPDRDDDGVRDTQDRCPDQPGLAEMAGCPDSDGDGIPDLDDECPTVSGLLQFRGCPDSDGDGIRDLDDGCPLAAGPTKLEGCPGPGGGEPDPTETFLPTATGSVSDRKDRLEILSFSPVPGTAVSSKTEYQVRVRCGVVSDSGTLLVTLVGFEEPHCEGGELQLAPVYEFPVQGEASEQNIAWPGPSYPEPSLGSNILSVSYNLVLYGRQSNNRTYVAGEDYDYSSRCYPAAGQ